jgi:hypothetical protein
MQPHNRKKLDDRVTRAAEAALAAQKFVSPIDVLLGIGWLDPSGLKRWRQGQVDSLDEIVRSTLPRISEATGLLQSWAGVRGLVPGEASYVARTPSRNALRFSRGGDPTIERHFRTHWMSGELSEKKRERLAEKASHAPELVVIQPLRDAWTCQKCGGTGDLLMMENDGPTCLRCAGLGDLVFLPAGAGDRPRHPSCAVSIGCISSSHSRVRA